ncbi:hypothetical protein WDS03_001417 [Campylobacter upsaliensis]|nr:hypothetical protein [Campylobacter upsaliensis]HEC1279228.1 hypothetical protein [Campylobacter upsaliensis]HEC1284167.1 hypothetical protein [Campylobacter upsaliensis]
MQKEFFKMVIPELSNEPRPLVKVSDENGKYKTYYFSPYFRTNMEADAVVRDDIYFKEDTINKAKLINSSNKEFEKYCERQAEDYSKDYRGCGGVEFEEEFDLFCSYSSIIKSDFQRYSDSINMYLEKQETSNSQNISNQSNHKLKKR